MYKLSLRPIVWIKALFPRSMQSIPVQVKNDKRNLYNLQLVKQGNILHLEDSHLPEAKAAATHTTRTKAVATFKAGIALDNFY